MEEIEAQIAALGPPPPSAPTADIAAQVDELYAESGVAKPEGAMLVELISLLEKQLFGQAGEGRIKARVKALQEICSNTCKLELDQNNNLCVLVHTSLVAPAISTTPCSAARARSSSALAASMLSVPPLSCCPPSSVTFLPFMDEKSWLLMYE